MRSISPHPAAVPVHTKREYYGDYEKHDVKIEYSRKGLFITLLYSRLNGSARIALLSYLLEGEEVAARKEHEAHYCGEHAGNREREAHEVGDCYHYAGEQHGNQREREAECAVAYRREYDERRKHYHRRYRNEHCSVFAACRGGVNYFVIAVYIFKRVARCNRVQKGRIVARGSLVAYLNVKA